MKPLKPFSRPIGDVIRYPKILIGVLALGCIVPLTSYGESIRACDVVAYGSFSTGETFNGTFSDDLAGTETVNWEHFAAGPPSIAFSTT